MEKLVNRFGYGEMYEWNVFPGVPNKFGRFVQFNEIEHDKINLAYDPNRLVIGVSSVNFAMTSDNPDNWNKKHKSNEFGDVFMMKERLAVGNKRYDQVEEFSYICTFPYEQYIPIENEGFNKDLKYVRRSDRNEWSNVIIRGKAIVKDNGKCVPGEYCKPNFSDITDEAGIAIPADKNDPHAYYVMSRYSDTTIMIFIA